MADTAKPRTQARRSVTLVDVAAAAGVSAATVSLVLNDRANEIAIDTRVRVRQAATQLQYRPNRIARYLRTGTRRTVGISMPLAHWGLVWMVRDLVGRLELDGYSVELMDSRADPNVDLSAVRTLVEHQAEAIVLVGGRPADWPAFDLVEELHRGGLPVAICTNPCLTTLIPYVTADQRRMGELATEHLIEQGHRRIGWIAGPQHDRGQIATDVLPALRFQGHRDAMAAAGLDGEPALRIAIERGEANAVERAIERMLGHERPDAVVAAGDELGLRTLRVCHRLSIRVPEDLALVALGDSPIVDLVEPAITNVVQPHAEYAQALAEILRGTRVDPFAWDGRSIITTPQLIVRGSSVRTHMTMAGRTIGAVRNPASATADT